MLILQNIYDLQCKKMYIRHNHRLSGGAINPFIIIRKAEARIQVKTLLKTTLRIPLRIW